MEVGSTVYGSFGRYGEVDVKPGKVVKVTPTGQVVVDFGLVYSGNQKPYTLRFKDGSQIGGDQWHPVQLINKAAYDRLKAVQDQRRAIRKVHTVARDIPKTSDKAELQALVDKLAAMVSALA